MNLKTFEDFNLSDVILRAIRNEGYELPTDIQRAAIPEILCVPGLFPSCAAHPYPPVTTNGVLETNAA